VNKSDGPVCSTDAPENVKQVTAVMQQSQSCSARKYEITLQMLIKSNKHFPQGLEVLVQNSIHKLTKPDKISHENLCRWALGPCG
jgi:hypothetical protein